ncbi:MAG: glycine--tRNA ligase, partial [Akkermansiaceae bacterium]
MANKDVTDPVRMEKIVSLCKRRGFIFQAGELYGGLNGCWDYGPLGAELKRNLKDYWWRKTVQERDDVLGMDGAILTMEEVLQSSGHIGGFSDPMCDCLLSKARLRADQIDPQDGTVYHFTGASLPESDWKTEKAYSVLQLPSQDEAKVRKTAREYYSQFIKESAMSKKDAIKAIQLAGETTEQVTGTTSYNPANGSLLTEPREFNLMLQTNFGATGDQVAYLRPET